VPKDVVVSAFANRQIHLVLANYGANPVTIETTQGFAAADDPRARTEKSSWELGARSLLILRRSATAAS